MGDEGDEFYMDAFWKLSTCRENGMGIGPIRWDVVVDYAQFHGLEDDVAAAFVEVIFAMDAAYLEWQREEQERERAAKETGRGG